MQKTQFNCLSLSGHVTEKGVNELHWVSWHKIRSHCTSVRAKRLIITAITSHRLSVSRHSFILDEFYQDLRLELEPS